MPRLAVPRSTEGSRMVEVASPRWMESQASVKCSGGVFSSGRPGPLPFATASSISVKLRPCVSLQV
jgi:hypothetical protein